MNYSLNAGAWNSVFAVPASVVDKYIKLASGNSLKLLLFLMRHGGRLFSEMELCDKLGFHREGELQDAALFWVQRGIIRAEEGVLSASADDTLQETLPEISAVAEKPAYQNVRKISDNATAIYTSGDIANRIKTDPAISYLFTEAEKLYSPGFTNPQKRNVLLLVDSYGLPPEVAAMLLRYCFKIGKTTPAYIQTVAQSWADDDIRSVSAADERLAALEKRFDTEEVLRTKMEYKTKFTQKQLNFIRVWSEEWGFDTDMIMLAHEITLDQTGNISFDYTNKILQNWNTSNIRTKEAAEAENSKFKSAKTAKKAPENSSINMDEVMSDVMKQYSGG